MKIIILNLSWFILFLKHPIINNNKINSSEIHFKKYNKISFKIKKRIWETNLQRTIKKSIEEYRDILSKTYDTIKSISYEVDEKFEKLLEYLNTNKENIDLTEQVLMSFYLKKLNKNKEEILKKLNHIDNSNN